MVDKRVIIVAVVCLLLLSSSGGFVYMKNQAVAEEERLARDQAAAAAAAAAAASAAAAAAADTVSPAKPTSTPAQKGTTQIVYVNNDSPSYRSGNHRMPLYPGASIDAVVGRKKDSATTYLMTTYPQLALRVVPYGTLVSYEPRSDRVTVVYDRYTERVISATIG